MKKLAAGLSLALLCTTSGCMGVASPALGAFYTDVHWNQSVTSNPGSSSHATDKAHSYFGFVAIGDVSVSNLMEQSGIKSVHHVDVHTQNILGFGTITMTIYGEK